LLFYCKIHEKKNPAKLNTRSFTLPCIFPQLDFIDEVQDVNWIVGLLPNMFLVWQPWCRMCSYSSVHRVL